MVGTVALAFSALILRTLFISKLLDVSFVKDIAIEEGGTNDGAAAGIGGMVLLEPEAKLEDINPAPIAALEEPAIPALELFDIIPILVEKEGMVELVKDDNESGPGIPINESEPDLVDINPAPIAALEEESAKPALELFDIAVDNCRASSLPEPNRDNMH